MDGTAAAYSSPFPVNGDGTHSLTYASSDGTNTEAPQSQTIRIDTVAPTLSLTPSRPPDSASGWYRSPVSLTLADSDATSGVASQQVNIDNQGWTAYSALISFGTDAKHTLDAQVTDVAGNQSASGVVVPVDMTAPQTTASLSGQLGQNGWYTSPTVVITLTAADATSGVYQTLLSIDGTMAKYTGPVTITGEGSHTVDYASVDVAGNVEATHHQIVLIDSVAPGLTLTPARPPDSPTGWWRSPVSVSVTSSDATSGIASQQINLDNQGWKPYDGNPIPLTSDLQHTVSIQITDVAGNTTTKSLTIPLDQTSPHSTLSFTDPVGGDAWHLTSPVKVALMASDGTSGVVRSTYAVDGQGGVYTGPFEVSGDGVHWVTYQSFDAAGNAEPMQQFPVSIDTVPPNLENFQCGPAVIGLGEDYGIQANVADNASGIRSVSLQLTSSQGQSFQADSASFSNFPLSAATGLYFSPSANQVGSYTVSLAITDRAGHTTQRGNLCSFEVTTTLPATSTGTAVSRRRPTRTPTPTATETGTATQTSTNTPTSTVPPTNTPRATATATATNTPRGTEDSDHSTNSAGISSAALASSGQGISGGVQSATPDNTPTATPTFTGTPGTTGGIAGVNNNSQPPVPLSGSGSDGSGIGAASNSTSDPLAAALAQAALLGGAAAGSLALTAFATRRKQELDADAIQEQTKLQTALQQQASQSTQNQAENARIVTAAEQEVIVQPAISDAMQNYLAALAQWQAWAEDRARKQQAWWDNYIAEQKAQYQAQMDALWHKTQQTNYHLEQLGDHWTGSQEQMDALWQRAQTTGGASAKYLPTSWQGTPEQVDVLYQHVRPYMKAEPGQTLPDHWTGGADTVIANWMNVQIIQAAQAAQYQQAVNQARQIVSRETGQPADTLTAAQLQAYLAQALNSGTRKQVVTGQESLSGLVNAYNNMQANAQQYMVNNASSVAYEHAGDAYKVQAAQAEFANQAGVSALETPIQILNAYQDKPVLDYMVDHPASVASEHVGEPYKQQAALAEWVNATNAMSPTGPVVHSGDAPGAVLNKYNDQLALQQMADLVANDVTHIPDAYKQQAALTLIVQKTNTLAEQTGPLPGQTTVSGKDAPTTVLNAYLNQQAMAYMLDHASPVDVHIPAQHRNQLVIDEWAARTNELSGTPIVQSTDDPSAILNSYQQVQAAQTDLLNHLADLHQGKVDASWEHMSVAELNALYNQTIQQNALNALTPLVASSPAVEHAGEAYKQQAAFNVAVEQLDEQYPSDPPVTTSNTPLEVLRAYQAEQRRQDNQRALDYMVAHAPIDLSHVPDQYKQQTALSILIDKTNALAGQEVFQANADPAAVLYAYQVLQRRQENQQALDDMVAHASAAVSHVPDEYKGQAALAEWVDKTNALAGKNFVNTAMDPIIVKNTFDALQDQLNKQALDLLLNGASLGVSHVPEQYRQQAALDEWVAKTNTLAGEILVTSDASPLAILNAYHVAEKRYEDQQALDYMVDHASMAVSHVPEQYRQQAALDEWIGKTKDLIGDKLPPNAGASDVYQAYIAAKANRDNQDALDYMVDHASMDVSHVPEQYRQQAALDEWVAKTNALAGQHVVDTSQDAPTVLAIYNKNKQRYDELITKVGSELLVPGEEYSIAKLDDLYRNKLGQALNNKLDLSYPGFRNSYGIDTAKYSSALLEKLNEAADTEPGAVVMDLKYIDTITQNYGVANSDGSLPGALKYLFKTDENDGKLVIDEVYLQNFFDNSQRYLKWYKTVLSAVDPDRDLSGLTILQAQEILAKLPSDKVKSTVDGILNWTPDTGSVDSDGTMHYSFKIGDKEFHGTNPLWWLRYQAIENSSANPRDLIQTTKDLMLTFNLPTLYGTPRSTAEAEELTSIQDQMMGAPAGTLMQGKLLEFERQQLLGQLGKANVPTSQNETLLEARTAWARLSPDAQDMAAFDWQNEQNQKFGAEVRDAAIEAAMVPLMAFPVTGIPLGLGLSAAQLYTGVQEGDMDKILIGGAGTVLGGLGAINLASEGLGLASSLSDRLPGFMEDLSAADGLAEKFGAFREFLNPSAATLEEDLAAFRSISDGLPDTEFPNMLAKNTATGELWKAVNNRNRPYEGPIEQNPDGTYKITYKDAEFLYDPETHETFLNGKYMGKHTYGFSIPDEPGFLSKLDAKIGDLLNVGTPRYAYAEASADVAADRLGAAETAAERNFSRISDIPESPRSIPDPIGNTSSGEPIGAMPETQPGELPNDPLPAGNRPPENVISADDLLSGGTPSAEIGARELQLPLEPGEVVPVVPDEPGIWTTSAETQPPKLFDTIEKDKHILQAQSQTVVTRNVNTVTGETVEIQETSYTVTKDGNPYRSNIETTVTRTLPDGTKEITYPTGAVQTIATDGTQVIKNGDNLITISNGSITAIAKDGTQTFSSDKDMMLRIVEPDGQQVTIERLTDEAGHLTGQSTLEIRNADGELISKTTIKSADPTSGLTLRTQYAIEQGILDYARERGIDSSSITAVVTRDRPLGVDFVQGYIIRSQVVQ